HPPRHARPREDDDVDGAVVRAVRRPAARVGPDEPVEVVVVDGLGEDAVPGLGGAAAREVPAVAVELPGREHEAAVVVDVGVGEGAV
ncbi:MAG: hypothetical protein LQ346_003889, partial [Caloplaca aetnensis]